MVHTWRKVKEISSEWSWVFIFYLISSVIIYSVKNYLEILWSSYFTFSLHLASLQITELHPIYIKIKQWHQAKTLLNLEFYQVNSHRVRFKWEGMLSRCALNSKTATLFFKVAMLWDIDFVYILSCLWRLIVQEYGDKNVGMSWEWGGEASKQWYRKKL